MEPRELQILVLASLLHDIGKFCQRAEEKTDNENLAQEYCPHDSSYRSTHRHVLHTDWFIEHHLPLPMELEGARGKLARMAAAHHHPALDSRTELCIRKGDCLSSGNDRMAGESGGDYKNARMESVFSQVYLRRHNLEGDPRRYVLKALDAKDSPIFPVSRDKAQATGYTMLYAEFLDALNALPLKMGVAHYIASVQTVLERFTWCIPSSTYKTRADISLFDHSYTTAAIAQALYCGEQPDEALDRTQLLLFGGELSGIQNFIFGQGEQGDRGASKLLRARSFSLQMLTRSIWMALLERCGLTPVARIMDAGGRFILLLPDTPAVREAVNDITRAAMRHVLKHFNGVLRVSFATQELKACDLEMERFHAVFQRMNDRLEREKLRPFAQLLAEGFSPVIGIKSADYAEHGPCPFCGLRPARADEDGEPVCRVCSDLKRVGRDLPDARYAVFSREKKGFELFDGLYLRLAKDLATADAQALDILSLKDRAAFSASPAAGCIPRITDDDLSRWREEKRSMPEEDGPLKPGDPKTFDVLAEEARIRTERGFRSLPCLAACKADVDNLGMIFGIGLESGGESRFSISRFAMLSRMMHHFFSSYLIRVIEKDFPNIYVVFAGGDDLFVLGPWSEAVCFAEKLYDAFSRFTGENPDVTLSAGVALVKSGLPMRAVKNLAEEQLEASKKREEKKNEKEGELVKNAVTLFGLTCPWQEFSPQLEKGEWLEDMCLKGNITQGLVRRLLGYSRQARAFAKGDISAGLYHSHMAYDMARNCKEMDPDDLKELREMVHSKSFEQMEISVTWALYRTRATA